MASPIRIGILNDLYDAPPVPHDVEPWLRFVTDEAVARGRIDRPVEFIQAYGIGLPNGTAATIERSVRSLVEQDVLMIVGPPIGDNALVTTPLADRYRIPILNWAGSERGRSEYMFHLQVGSHEEDSIVVARHVHAIGAKRVSVIYDRSGIGQHHFDFFRAEADMLGIRVAATVTVSPIAEDATTEIAELTETRADAVVYLGVGAAAPATARALSTAGWRGPRAMNTAGIRGYAPEVGRAFEGWDYVDMFSDANRTLAEMLEKPGVPHDGKYHSAARYDLGQLVTEGIARASDLTRGGIRDGLERIKWLPAAEGYDGTILSLGHYDHGALHGRYLVMRTWRDGQSIEFA